MKNNEDILKEKKYINKTKSCAYGVPIIKTKSDTPTPARIKSFNSNEAVKSLDLAIGRLKKSKLVIGEGKESKEAARFHTDMFMDSRLANSTQINNASLLSFNFSHYDLQRNLSCLSCGSGQACSDVTGSTCLSPRTDGRVKDEHLERYFRSVEMWKSKCNRGGPSRVHFDIPEK